jgi:chaperone required for assembly of F1-ATPase
MKRFWTKAEVRDGAILLDERPVKTPARATLQVAAPALAEAIAAEWNAQEKDVDPRSMPFTGLANAAIDRVMPDAHAFAADLARYAETDVLCYRAEEPEPLVRRQAEEWDPLLDWARARYDVHFVITSGIVHAAQPLATVGRLGEAVCALDPFRLAALSPLVTISGSLVTSLALLAGEADATRAFDATHLDELWQIEQWGEDALAADTRAARRRDFEAAARFLTLLD